MNGKDLNAMVKRAVKANLSGGGNKRIQGVAADINTYSNDEVFGIDRINLADSEWQFEQYDGKKSTTVKTFTS